MSEREVKKERFKITPAVFLLLEKEGKVLLMQRQNTGHEDGNFGLPSGHKESGETPKEAIQREGFEELEIKFELSDLQLVHTMARIRAVDSERVDFYFRLRKWEGEPQNAEPDKCAAVDWFLVNNLPQNTIPYVKEAIRHIQNGIIYSEFDSRNFKG